MIFEVEYNTIKCLLRRENSESDLHFNLTKYICYRNCSWQKKKTGEWSVGRVGNIPCFFFFFQFYFSWFQTCKDHCYGEERPGEVFFTPQNTGHLTSPELTLRSIVVPDPMRFCWASRCPRNGSHQFVGYVLTQFG